VLALSFSEIELRTRTTLSFFFCLRTEKALVGVGEILQWEWLRQHGPNREPNRGCKKINDRPSLTPLKSIIVVGLRV